MYATYLGGSGSDIAGKIAVDAESHAYVAGYTNSIDLPATDGAFDESCGTDGNCNSVKRDCFVAKLDADGANLAYLTYLGGSAFDRCFGVDVDANGRAVVVGSTFSADFPATPGAYDTTCGDDGNCDAGGPDATADDGFVAMLDAAGANLVYATFLGGSGNGDATIDEYGWAVRVDADGSATIVGETDSSDFPTPNGARTTYGGGILDAFVAQLDADRRHARATRPISAAPAPTRDSGSRSTRSASSSSPASPIRATSRASTRCPAPATNAPTARSRFTEGFVTMLDTSGADFSFSTFLGGSSSDYAPGVAVRRHVALRARRRLLGRLPDARTRCQAAHGAGANYDVFVARIEVPEPAAALLRARVDRGARRLCVGPAQSPRDTLRPCASRSRRSIPPSVTSPAIAG